MFQSAVDIFHTDAMSEMREKDIMLFFRRHADSIVFNLDIIAVFAFFFCRQLDPASASFLADAVVDGI